VARIDITLTDTINPNRWRSSSSCRALRMTGATREPLDRSSPIRTRARDVRSVMQEVVAVGRAKGVRLPDDFVADRMRFAEGSPPGFKRRCCTISSAATGSNSTGSRAACRARPRARRAGADEQRDLRVAQAAPDGTPNL